MRPYYPEKDTFSMQVYQRKADLLLQLSELKAQNKTIGFVPTMGALHTGHLSLVQNALKANDVVVCSIFVNPTQFNESQDFEKYPKTLSKDCDLLEEIGCQIVYAPSVDDVYENELKLSVDLADVEHKMEGAKRPGHFEGVIRVLTQLFGIVKPDASYFGLKDYQQYLVVKMLSEQYDVGGKIVGCETVREDSGLAKSSRNQLLSDEQKKVASQIYTSFQKIKTAESISSELEHQKEVLSEYFDVEYLTLRDGKTLEEIESLTSTEHARLFFAGKLGNVRLIDNLKIK